MDIDDDFDNDFSFLMIVYCFVFYFELLCSLLVFIYSAYAAKHNKRIDQIDQ